MIFFWKGELIHVDNKSGHDAPKADALFKVVEVLRDGERRLTISASECNRNRRKTLCGENLSGRRRGRAAGLA